MPGTLYAGTTYGVFKSTNAGRSWQAADFGVPTVFVLAVDPHTPTTLYAGTFRNGVFKSTDGADSWSAANTGLPSNTDGTDVPVLESGPADPQTEPLTWPPENSTRLLRRSVGPWRSLVPQSRARRPHTRRMLIKSPKGPKHR